MAKDDKKILIAGACTGAWWNAGDEAIFSAMLADLRAKLPTSEISVLSANPLGALRDYHVEEIPVGDIGKLIQTAKESDLMILGGGGLFYDYWGFNVNELLTSNHMGHGIYVDFALLATLLHKPLMIYAVGVGPLFSETARSFTRMIFEQAHQVTVRDAESKDLLQSLGIPSDRVLITADPVFGAQEVPLEIGNEIIQATSNRPPILGVCLRSWKTDSEAEKAWQAAVARSLDRFIEHYDGTILFIPFHKKVDQVDDYTASSKVRRLMKHADQAFLLEDSYSLEEKVSILRRCELVMGMRLHSLIYAVRYGIPSIGLAYDPKVSHLYTSLHQEEYQLNLQDLNEDDLFSALQMAYEKRNSLRDFYTQKGIELAGLAHENATLAMDLLQSGLPASSYKVEAGELAKSLLVEQSLRSYKKEQALKELSTQAREKERVFAEKERVITEKEQTINELRQTLNRVTQMLNEIQMSRSWRLVQILQRIRLKVAPPGSLRSRLLGGLFRSLLNGYRKLRPVVTSAAQEESSLPDFIGRHISSASDTRVLLITKIFFDPMGNDMQFGGAERYLLELADIVRSYGCEPVIVQCGNEYWMRYYGSQPVVGIRVGYDYESFIPELEKLSPRGALAVYSPFELSSSKIQMPAIGISHGIYWDDERYYHSHDELLATINRLKNQIDALDTLISVDTNTINWLRTVSPTNAQKSVYIPNFVDLAQFSSLPVKKDNQRLNILFPRRLVHQRGFWLVHQILPSILEKYPHVDFHFVGKGGPQEQQAITLISQNNPNRVYWYFLSPEEMHTAYQKADITLIPTTQSEGTSLSCLEALAMGNAVIATTVGGLPDLILDGYNGLLIEPTAEALQKALECLIEDQLFRQTLGMRGQEVVKTFSIDHWKDKWRDIFQKYLPSHPGTTARPNPRFVVFPYTWGLHWHGVKQRPHHLAVQFSLHGFETYWHTPEGRQPDPAPGIHLISRTDELYVTKPILFIYYPHSFPEIGRYKDPIVIYDVLDDISIYEASGSDEKTAREGREYHQKLLERADIVLASSRLLMDQIHQKRPDVVYLPNGVDVEHFHFERHKPIPDIRVNQKPIIGYHGAVASWFDGNLVARTAQLRPDYQFIIIGPVSDGDVEAKLRSQSNIQILGAIPYEDLPSYVARFDVGIMPFVLSKLTHAVRPLKIVEYLSMHKPVVATPIREILDWPGILFAEDPQSFAEKLDLALKTGLQDEESVEAFVMDSAWSKAIQPLLKILDEKRSQNDL